ncbi:hypothetical protein K438DRAFT_1952359 [Mycena galopus ATCC 62051]|nr:hypothetical protein K438DRAFT_1952359 [Mycena galopus ATCC 62051]
MPLIKPAETGVDGKRQRLTLTILPEKMCLFADFDLGLPHLCAVAVSLSARGGKNLGIHGPPMENSVAYSLSLLEARYPLSQVHDEAPPRRRAVTVLVSRYRDGNRKVLDTEDSRAHFQRGDATCDWVTTYLDHHQVWNQSRAFNVTAKNAEKIKDREFLEREHGFVSLEEATLDYGLVSVDKSELVLRVWSLYQGVLDDFIQEAREFYLQRSVRPPIVNPSSGSAPLWGGTPVPEFGSLLITGIFDGGK